MLNVNSTQRSVLEWLNTDQSTDPPSSEWKTSARALERRGLAKVTRPKGKFTARITNAGIEFLKTEPAPVSEEKVDHATITASIVSTMLPPIPDTFSKLHPAVRSLKRHPRVLPTNPEARERALTAAQYLILAAKSLGIEVEGHEQPTELSRSLSYPNVGTPLLTLKMGNISALVRIGENTSRVKHQLTEEEQREKERNGYYWGRSYDYIESGKNFFRINEDFSESKKLVETDRKPLIDYVPNVIAFVLRQCEKERIRAEEAKIEAAQRAAAEKARQLLLNRRREYNQWETALTKGYKEWDRLQRLRAFVNALADHDDSDEAHTFIQWAREHIDALDPIENFTLPTANTPDLSHEERVEYGKLEEPKNVYRYGW
ncbi:hypothetical protein [Arcanobacterium phocae]|uniref:hypothetical protein n=1 Tax=Arcanobacterium phocae TaxID=131112 RepID=UPI001C0ED432|nr:hypothetical protein [Arcanobacterium phocae]